MAVRVYIVDMLSNFYVVNYNGGRYLLSEYDIFFVDGNAYTYKERLIQRY